MIKKLTTLFMVCTLTAMSLPLTGTQANAEESVKMTTLELKTEIDSYDITGDGMADTILIDCDKPSEDSDYPEFGTGWKIYVNDQVVYRNNADYVSLLVNYYRFEDNRCYLEISTLLLANDDIADSALYQYKNNKLKKVCDFYRPFVKNMPYYGHFHANITKMTSELMTVSFKNMFLATAITDWTMTYRYESGKWVKPSNTANITYPLKKLTACREFTAQTKAGGKKTAFIVKTGDNVKLKKICMKKKHTYFQIVNADGKKGWFVEPEHGISDQFGDGYFKQVEYAG